MKRIEDAPKELQQMFNVAWDDILFKDKVSKDKSKISYEEIAEHLFLKGFGVAMATGGMKPKRKIAEVTSNANGQWIVRSNDGKLYIYGADRGGVPQWLPYPDLPQE